MENTHHPTAPQRDGGNLGASCIACGNMPDCGPVRGGGVVRLSPGLVLFKEVGRETIGRRARPPGPGAAVFWALGRDEQQDRRPSGP